MSGLLKILILDDNRLDAELISRDLKRAGLAFDWEQAACKSEYIAALDRPFDIILADYTLPDFNALTALEYLKDRHLKTPLIVVTGSLGDEAAAECIKQGATDYLLKDRMKRLGSAVTRALEEKRKRDQQILTEERLRQSQQMAAESLRRMNATLEERVQERTHALLEANEQLRHETAERIKAEEALAQAQKMEAIGQLTGGIAHDFNNLLQVIVGNLDRLMRQPGVSDAPKSRTFVESAISGVKRGEQLVKGLLAFGRRQPLAPRPFDANELVMAMATMIRRTLGGTMTVETVLQPGPVLAYADTHQLEGALLNLAINARDAMPAGGVMTMRTKTIADMVQIEVSDTGCGMPPDILAKAMEPFFTTKEVGQGSGLGLSQVYGYASQSGGHIDIQSTPHVGTTVMLRLPCAENDIEAPPVETVAKPIVCAPCTATVLVVEDEKIVQAAAAGTLEEFGYHVLVADHAAAALEILHGTEPVDLLFSDIIMPGGMNGVELAMEATRLRPSIKVILASGYTRNILLTQHGLGANIPVLHKPYRASDLGEQLECLLKSSDRTPAAFDYSHSD